MTATTDYGTALPALPNAAYTAGTLYVRTADYTMWLCDGAAWRQVSGVAVAPSPAPPPRVATDRRPFSPTLSPWNRTVQQRYAAGAPIVAPALNDRYLENISNNMPTQWWPYFSSDTSHYTMAPYVVTASWIASTPHTVIASSGIHCESSDSATTTGNGSPTTLPFRIPSTLKPAPGSDAQFVLWDRDNLLGHGGEFWDCWQIPVDNLGCWLPDGSGRLQVTNFSHFVGEIASDGVPATSPSVYASRGPGIPYMTGLVRKWEIDYGVVEHPIACAWNAPANTFTYPACKSDGHSTITNDMPEGGLLYLNPAFPVQDLSNPVARIIATAMQQYGCIVADTSGSTKIYCEADESVGLGPYWGGLMPPDVMNEVPINEFRCVDPSGSSLTRDADIRLDYTVASADPLPTLPALLETQVAVSSSPASADMTVATAGPMTVGQLCVCFVTLKGTRGQNVASVSGTGGMGGPWKRLMRGTERSALGQNLSVEVWWTRASSTVAGTATINCRTLAPATGTVILGRFTAGSAIRKKFSNSNTSATPQTWLRGCTAQSLVVQLLGHRGATATAATAESGATGVVMNLSAGATSNAIRSSLITRLGGGDVKAAPTISTAQEWVSVVVEVT